MSPPWASERWLGAQWRASLSGGRARRRGFSGCCWWSFSVWSGPSRSGASCSPAHGPLTTRPADALGSAGRRHFDDHVALLVPLVDIAVRLYDLVQREAAVDHRTQLATLGELLERQQV